MFFQQKHEKPLKTNVFRTLLHRTSRKANWAPKWAPRNRLAIEFLRALGSKNCQNAREMHPFDTKMAPFDAQSKTGSCYIHLEN